MNFRNRAGAARRYLVCDLHVRGVLHAAVIFVSSSSAATAGAAMVHLDRDHCCLVSDCCIRVLLLRALMSARSVETSPRLAVRSVIGARGIVSTRTRPRVA